MEISDEIRAAIEKLFGEVTAWEAHELTLSSDFKAAFPMMAEFLKSCLALSIDFAPYDDPDPNYSLPARNRVVLFHQSKNGIEKFYVHPTPETLPDQASDSLSLFLRELGSLRPAPTLLRGLNGSQTVSDLDEDLVEALEYEVEDWEEDEPDLKGTLSPFPLYESLLIGTDDTGILVVEYENRVYTAAMVGEGEVWRRLGASFGQHDSNIIYKSDEIQTFDQLVERIAEIALGRFTPDQKEIFETDQDITV